MVFRLAHFKSDQMVYRLDTLSDRMGSTLAFRYLNILQPYGYTDYPINTRPLLVGIDRIVGGARPCC
jgi:hypothetical protein